MSYTLLCQMAFTQYTRGTRDHCLDWAANKLMPIKVSVDALTLVPGLPGLEAVMWPGLNRPVAYLSQDGVAPQPSLGISDAVVQWNAEHGQDAASLQCNPELQS